MNNKYTAKEIAFELMKAIQPKLNKMQKEIDNMNKEVTSITGRIQTLSSILMNKRKHPKKKKRSS